LFLIIIVLAVAISASSISDKPVVSTTNQQVTSVATTPSPTIVTPPAKPKPQAVKPKPATQKRQTSQDTAQSAPLKTELKKQEAPKVSAPPEKPTATPTETKFRLSDIPYTFIFGILFLLLLIPAYFYFRNKNRFTDKKVYASDELKRQERQSYEQAESKPEVQPSPINEIKSDPQPQSSTEEVKSETKPNTDEEVKK